MSKVNRRKFLIAAGGTAVAAAAIAGGAYYSGLFGPTQEPGEIITELEAAARKEGKLAISGDLTEAQFRGVVGAFTEKYPWLEVEWTRMVNDQVDRIKAEKLAGKLTFDIGEHSNVGTLYTDQIKLGWMEPFNCVYYKNYPTKYIEKGNLAFTFWPFMYGIGYNTNLAKQLAGKAPTKLTDMLDKGYKGRIGLVDPRTGAGNYYFYYWIYKDLYGKDFFTKLGENGPILPTQSSSVVLQKLVSGELAIGPVVDNFAWALQDQGAPVGFTYAEEGTVNTAFRGWLYAGAPHPNAGKLFITWFTSPEGQDFVVNKLRYVSVMNEHIDKPPRPGVPALKDVKSSDPSAEATEQVKTLAPQMAQWLQLA